MSPVALLLLLVVAPLPPFSEPAPTAPAWAGQLRAGTEVIVAPVIPPEGNAWATVVKNRDGRRVDVIDGVRQPGNTSAEKVPGRSYIYLNRGIPAALPLPAETLAGLTERDDERTAAALEEDERDERTRLLSGLGPWTAVITGAAELNRAAADRLNTVTERSDGAPRVWAAGDYAVRVVPSARVRLAAFSRNPAAPKVELDGYGWVRWPPRRPEVWRHRAGEWTLIDPGVMYLDPIFLNR